MLSTRQLVNGPGRPRYEQLNSANGHLELVVSNTCDLACRYCGVGHSSVWAERTKHTEWQRAVLHDTQDSLAYQNLLEEVYDWIADRMSQWHKITFTGGEVAIMPRFYDLIDRLDFRGKVIKIMTNLNTPDSYMDRFTETLCRLSAAGNQTEIRASIDGIGLQNDWQRQGANWDQMRKNWLRLAPLPVQVSVALTMTPLTLEGMVGVGQFVADTAVNFANSPTWEVCNHVTNPAAMDPEAWYGLFQQDIRQFQQLISAPGVQQTGVMDQTISWLAQPKVLEPEQVRQLVSYLDRQEQQWGGPDQWRNVYPRVWALCQARL